MQASFKMEDLPRVDSNLSIFSRSTRVLTSEEQINTSPPAIADVNATLVAMAVDLRLSPCDVTSTADMTTVTERGCAD